jgi:putative SOS response-associated peptidase YedK
MTNADVVCGLLKPYDPRLMRSYAVSPRVNNVANDDQECSAQVELIQAQSRLF